MIRIENLEKRFKKIKGIAGYQCAVQQRAGGIVNWSEWLR